MTNFTFQMPNGDRPYKTNITQYTEYYFDNFVPLYLKDITKQTNPLLLCVFP